MKISEMFAEDINRPINGVIKVDQDSEDVTRQEVQEYVITKELKKHFISFFDFYSESVQNPTPTAAGGFRDSLEVVNRTS
ncbi:MAG: hypothetical protein LUC60_11265 [Lachnospiraceae bacterium]|nr:hypothetical protein [Lachnospiraceae bacterium]